MRRTRKDEPSKAEQLASILDGTGSSETYTSSVQRSHRFPIYYYVLIENMAKIAGCSVSAMINQVIEVGVDALYETLPQETVEEIHKVTEEQIKKGNSQLRQTIGKKKTK